MIEKIKRNIIIAIICSAVIYAALSLYQDSEEIFTSLTKINYFNLPLILFLSFMTFFFRFIQWHEYLRYFKLNIPVKNSFIIFFSSQIMSVTPGKIGELIKAYMLKKDFGSPVSTTSSIIVAERITEMLALIFMALVGAFLFEIHLELIISVMLLFILVLYILTHEKLCIKVLTIFTSFKFLERHQEGIINTYKSVVELIRIGILLKMIIISMISWAFECFAFYLILLNFNADTTIVLATFIFTFSIIIGSFSMIPGGIGVAEGSLTLLLSNFGFTYSAALASTLVLRICTLWFSVLLGIIFLSIYQAKYGKVRLES